MPARVLRRLVLVLFAAVLLYSLYLIWQGLGETTRALARFPWPWLPLILGLVSANFVIRELE